MLIIENGHLVISATMIIRHTAAISRRLIGQILLRSAGRQYKQKEHIPSL